LSSPKRTRLRKNDGNLPIRHASEAKWQLARKHGTAMFRTAKLASLFTAGQIVRRIVGMRREPSSRDPS
jgi:hypothetical protein